MKKIGIVTLGLLFVTPAAQAEDFVCPTVCVMEVTGSTTVVREMTPAELSEAQSRQPVLRAYEPSKEVPANTHPYNPNSVEHYYPANTEEPNIAPPSLTISDTATAVSIESTTASIKAGVVQAASVDLFSWETFWTEFEAWFKSWFTQFLMTWGK